MGVAPSCTCNGMILVERRRIVDAVKERGWELVPHNWAQNDLLTYYAHNPEQERAVIRRTLDKYQEVVGKPAKAWLSSAIRGTAHTPAFLKEFGLVAYCDYLNDDQPYLIDTCTARSFACRIPTTSTTSTCSRAAGSPPATASRCSSFASISFTPRARLRPHHERRPASACHRPAASHRCAAGIYRTTSKASRRSGFRPASRSPTGIWRRPRSTCRVRVLPDAFD